MKYANVYSLFMYYCFTNELVKRVTGPRGRLDHEDGRDGSHGLVRS
jgi:hypothetical protein